MKPELHVALRVTRDKFIMEHFIGTDDIFALVKEGSFSMESEGQRAVVQKNEGALFRKNVLYRRHVITPVTLYLFRYKSEKSAFDSDHVIFRDQARLSTTLSMLDRLHSEVFHNDFECRAHLFSDLIMQYEMENRQAPTADPLIIDAIEKIRTSLHTGVDLAGIGAESGLSYVQFLRRFKALTGISPSEYLIALRLQKAKMLLSDTNLRIKEIASACGFENEYYFSNFFKKHVSVSPSAFRISTQS